MSKLSKNYVELSVSSWQLDSLVNFQPEKNLERPVTLTFGKESKVYGFAGCNYYGGKFQQERNKLSFSDIFSTKKYCFEGSKTETQFTYALLEANTVAADGRGNLLLKKDETTLAILHKIDFIAE